MIVILIDWSYDDNDTCVDLPSYHLIFILSYGSKSTLCIHACAHTE